MSSLKNISLWGNQLAHMYINIDAEKEEKDYVKFLGVLIDKNLTWRHHIDYIASKISKIVGTLARLRHHVPLSILLEIYRPDISLLSLRYTCLGASSSA